MLQEVKDLNLQLNRKNEYSVKKEFKSKSYPTNSIYPFKGDMSDLLISYLSAIY